MRQERLDRTARNGVRWVRAYAAELQKHAVRITAVLAAFLVPILILAIVGVPHVFRGPTRMRVATLAGGLSDGASFEGAAALTTGVPFAAAIRTEILSNGAETYSRLWSELRAARRSVTIQMYSAGPGQLADSLAAVLVERARAGVPIFLLFDAFGAHELERTYVTAMGDAGIHVAMYKPIRWYALDRANNRSHVRGVVIDGAVGYTGGFGFDDRWLGNGREPGEWREANVRFEGPVVAQLQAAFVANWAIATGDLVADTVLLADGATLRPHSDASVADPSGRASVMLSEPIGAGASVAARLLAFSIATSQKRLFITNAYFVPPADFVDLLISAARRGVDVRVLTNGPRTDVPSTWLAGHTRYKRLLEGGVRIFEYRVTTLHSKTLVADGIWSVIGTANFDNRSLAYNSEIAFATSNPCVGSVMDSLFSQDLRHADEIRLADFERRSLSMRFRERIAGMIAELL